MKKFYFLLLSLFITVGAMAQMTITQEGNTVTFTYDSAGTIPNNSGGDLDLGGTVPNLYAWIDTADVTGADPNYGVLGNWPGTPMTDIGNGVWQAVVDLGTLYQPGVMINQIRWIINGNGQQTSDMMGTDYGFTAFTIQALSVNDVNANAKKVVAVGSQLFVNQSGTYQVAVYNVNGKLVNQFTTNATAGSMISLNLTAKGIYFVQVKGENGAVQNIKVLR